MSEKESRQRLTITDIESKQFRRVAYGYDQHEVDEFLDCICDEMEQLAGEVAQLQRQVEFAKAETRMEEASVGAVAPAAPAADDVPADAFRELLEMAQSVKDQTISDAKAKAEEIVAEAHTQAKAELGGLQEQHDMLQEAVKTLRAKAREYRDAVAGLIREHQEALDAIELADEE